MGLFPFLMLYIKFCKEIYHAVSVIFRVNPSTTRLCEVEESQGIANNQVNL